MPKKPHKGVVERWYKIPIDPELTKQILDKYGETPGLGYCIGGTCIKHPIFGTSYGFRSSWVTKRVGNEIWTRNSRYTLGNPLEA